MVTTCEDTVTGSCRHRENTQKFVSPVNNRAQISAPLSTHILEQVKSDLLKETSTSKPRKGNQGLPENSWVAQHSGRREEQRWKQHQEQPRAPQGAPGPLGESKRMPHRGLVRHRLGGRKRCHPWDIPRGGQSSWALVTKTYRQEENRVIFIQSTAKAVTIPTPSYE